MFTKLAIAAAIASSQPAPIFAQDETTTATALEQAVDTLEQIVDTNTNLDTNSILQDVENAIGDTCIKNFDANNIVDLFPTKWSSPDIKTYGDIDLYGAKFEPSVTTELLDITYHMNYKIIHNHFVNATYLLYQCGTEPPQEEVESGKHKLILEVPHKGGLALTSTVQIPAIELLGLRSEVKAYVG